MTNSTQHENSNMTTFPEQILPRIPIVVRGGQQARFEAFKSDIAEFALIKNTLRFRVVAIGILSGWDRHHYAVQ